MWIITIADHTLEQILIMAEMNQLGGDVKHTHKTQHPVRITESELRTEVCECGATRQTKHGERPKKWHTCTLCTHPWGSLNKIEGE